MERIVCTYPWLRVPGVPRPTTRLLGMTVGCLATIAIVHRGRCGWRVATKHMQTEDNRTRRRWWHGRLMDRS